MLKHSFTFKIGNNALDFDVAHAYILVSKVDLLLGLQGLRELVV